MSELIQKNNNRAAIRRKLLATASAFAMTAYLSAANTAKAEDANRPLIWLELSGDMEMLQGTSKPFSADFMFPTSPPDDNVYGGKSFAQKQQPSRFAFGGGAKIIFQPEDSDWLFSAEIRYGRSHSNRHTHYQGPALPPPKYAAAFSDTLSKGSESHAVADFSAGKDVGLGLFGKDGSSTVNAGIRFAQFTAKSSAHISARPFAVITAAYHYLPSFNQYYLTGHQARSFKGIGPSLSWNASVALAGNPDRGELALDWGVSGALLFGRQKAKIDHATHAFHYKYGAHPLYTRTANPPIRSHRVTVPELSGFVGLSAKLPHSKLSIGYRGDIWFGAVDRGIDVAKKSNLTFNGPYASISIGLGD